MPGHYQTKGSLLHEGVVDFVGPLKAYPEAFNQKALASKLQNLKTARMYPPAERLRILAGVKAIFSTTTVAGRISGQLEAWV